MFSAKKIFLGSLAIGGLVGAGYLAYSYYKTGTTGLFAAVQDDDVQHRREETSSQKIISRQDESTEKFTERVDETACQGERESNEEPEVKEVGAQERMEVDSPVESSMSEEESGEEDISLVPTRRIVRLQHVRTAEELDMTFQGLADYYFNHHRSREELRAAEQELAWAWPLILGYRNRVPENDSLDSEEGEYSSSSLERGYENGIEDSS